MDIMPSNPHVKPLTGLTGYDYEPYTMQNVLAVQWGNFMCGNRAADVGEKQDSNDTTSLTMQPLLRKPPSPGERENRCGSGSRPPTASFGSRRKKGSEYLVSERVQPLCVSGNEDESYEIRIQDVKLFPQGYCPLFHPNVFGTISCSFSGRYRWLTVDLMRLDKVPKCATCRTELGVIRVMITEQVRRNTGLSVTDIQIETCS